MGENIIRRVMTRLLFELQPALWHYMARQWMHPKKTRLIQHLMR